MEFMYMTFGMTDELWAWVGMLGAAGVVSLMLAFRLPKQRWPRVMAVTAGGTIASILCGETSAIGPILLTGLILAICSLTAARE